MSENNIEMENVSMSNKEKPDAFLLGNIKLVVFKNQVESGEVYFKYVIEKIYKTKDGEWGSTNSFDKTDLLKISVLLNNYFGKDFKKL